MRKLALLVLLLLSACLFADYKVIQRAPDGRYYLTEDAVIQLANYIYKLEELNQNYKLQIANLEKQVENLKQQIAWYENQLAEADKRYKELEAELKKLQLARDVWTVVAAISIGQLVILFIK